jgi:hypothetical protein
MTYHKFYLTDVPDENHITIAVSNAKKCRVVRVVGMNLYQHLLNKTISRKFYRRFCKPETFEHTVMSEDDYLLDLI